MSGSAQWSAVVLVISVAWIGPKPVEVRVWTRDGERKENVRVLVMMDVYDENMATPCGDYGGATACDL